MNRSVHIICTYTGLLFAVFLGAAFLTAGWLPPLPAHHDAAAVADIFREDNLRIKVGASVLALGSVFWLPFSAAIAMQMSRTEGKMPVLSTVQIASALGVVAILLSGSFSWINGAYRVDSAPDIIIQKFSDLGWIWFVAAYPALFMQNTSIGFCILSDKSINPVFPRWAGFANLWLAILALPGVFVPFFTTGPFAWNGLIAFWIPVIAFFIWLIMMWHLNLKAIRNYTD